MYLEVGWIIGYLSYTRTRVEDGWREDVFFSSAFVAVAVFVLMTESRKKNEKNERFAS